MDNKNIYYVYEWIRLDTNEPFYVGKGKGDRCYRLKRGKNNHFNNIVKSIPVAVYILHDNLIEDEANEYECWYINEYKYNIGYDLVNITDGGEGVSGYKPSKEEVKRNRIITHGFDIEDYKDEIIDMYINKIMSSDQIAAHFKVSDVCIRRVLKKFKVVLRRSGSIKCNDRGLKRYNSKCILVKDINNNIINCFESLILCGKWLSSIGLVKLSSGSRKAIRTNIDTDINYKGLLFYTIKKEQYYKLISQNDIFVEFKINEINIKSMAHSTIIEVYNKNIELLQIFPSLNECVNWLLDINLSKSYSSGRDAIYRNMNNNKFYKNTYTFKQYSKSEYNKLVYLT